MGRLDENLTARLERLAAGEGLELLAVEVMGTARKPIVRLVLDRPEQGVSLEDCELVSRQASVLLDAHDPFPGSYTLEVTSPGLDRKLYSDNDYVRFSGQPVRVRMRPTWTRTSRLVEGVLEGRGEGVVRVRDRKGALVELPVDEVFETRLDPFAPGATEPGGRRGTR
ncbi:MAG: ribosome maturation factor RimP [Acidobacteriota bacterium]